VVERCLGSILILLSVWIGCNASAVLLLHASALVVAFLYMNNGGLEWTERKIRKRIKAIDFRWRQKFKWIVESTGVKLVDCCQWFKSWLKCKGTWTGCMEAQKAYSRRNQLKRSLSRCVRNRNSGRLMAIKFLAITCFSAVVGTEAFCQPCCASTMVFEAKHGADGKPFSNAWDTDSGRVGVDCRASACMSNRIEDFVPGSLQPCNKRVQTFGGHHVSNIQVGTIHWEVQSDDGQTHVFEIPKSYYVPEGGARLLSPQHWSSTRPKTDQIRGLLARSVVTGKSAKLEWNRRKAGIELRRDTKSNVFDMILAPGIQAYQGFVEEAGLENDLDPVALDAAYVSDDEDESLSPEPRAQDMRDWESDWEENRDKGAQLSEGEPGETTPAFRQEPVLIDFLPEDFQTSERVVYPDEEDKPLHNHAAELLRVHHRLNHIAFAKLKVMAKQGLIPKRLQHVEPPACSACLYGKASRRPWRSKPKRDRRARMATKVGEIVSVDMLKSPVPGLIAQMSGWITGKRYWYATVYVDHYSRFGYVHSQKTQSADETLEGKLIFERKAALYGVTVQHYHADNGIFVSKAWKDDCLQKRQGFTYSGVNAHFQSGIAERRIREVQNAARVMLIHAQSRWPEAISTNLWPYAIRTAMDTYCEAPLKALNEKSPAEVFTSGIVKPEPRLWRPWGCPVYVLDNALQQGKPKAKWQDRSRVGTYIGRSPFHARTVALVLSLTTGRVSPQFHVQYDPSFQTVKASFGGSSPPSLWQSVCGFGKSSSGSGLNQSNLERADARVDLNSRAGPAPGIVNRSPFDLNTGQLEEDEETNAVSNAVSRFNSGIPVLSHEPVHNDHNDAHIDGHTDSDAATPRRSTRARIPVVGNRLVDLATEVLLSTSVQDCDPYEDPKPSAPAQGELFCLSSLFPFECLPFEDDPLLAYGASNDPDVFYYHEAIKEPDADDFKIAMVKEIKDQWDNGNFRLIERDKVPPDKKILPGVWALRRKREVLTRAVKKHKARWNLDGSKQTHGVDFDMTYSPTANWASIRLLLTLTLLNGWHTRQLDFVQAYPQAKISHQQFVELPKGIDIEGVDPRLWVFEVINNVYGGKDAGRQWYLHLKDKLEAIGFRQSAFDECTFYRGRVMYCLYTDDTILAGPTIKEINECIRDMEKAGLILTVEGELADFLGVNITRNDDGTFTLTQPSLIDSIIEEVFGKDPDALPSAKSTPMASSKLLSRHLGSPEFHGSYQVRRIVGKLNFLANSSRADIAYATHQIARFVASPRIEHGEAIEWLVRYLIGTRNKGCEILPDEDGGIELYADADFAGNWDPSLAGEDIDTARSRHGYVLYFAGVPILWKSQLQTEIALSSTEAEVIGLSAALRTSIPIVNMIREMAELGFPILDRQRESSIHCQVFEDNSGALQIATVPKMRPRTKHINNKYFHFVEYTTRDDSPFSFHKVGTEEQTADMLTKPLSLPALEKHRKSILGW
jgi:Reverse transcriptase (RNA-dependent DNA polymerase)